jgi:predicted DNA-binding protein with PD1-like motif
LEPEEAMHVFEVRNAELMASIAAQAKAAGIANGAIVSLIGAVDAFTVSTMPTDDATKDMLTDYTQPAEMSGTGEIVNGTVHVHAVMAVAGDTAISGHLHMAMVGTHFARVYVVEVGHKII